MNDNPPVFEQSTYLQSIPEASLIGTSVLQVQAFSHDIGDNAIMSYALVGGNVQGHFAVDVQTGYIYLVEQFIVLV